MLSQSLLRKSTRRIWDSPYAQNIPIIVWEGFWISQKLLEEDEKLSKRS